MLSDLACPIQSGGICTILWSMTPLLEIRASIPLGYLTFGLPLWQAIGLSILGCAFISLTIYLLMPVGEWFVRKFMPFFNPLIDKIFEHTRHKHSKKMETIGALFLISFIAIPLPGSGGFTGALVCYLFGVPRLKSMAIITIGLILSAFFVAGVTLFGAQIWQSISGFF